MSAVALGAMVVSANATLVTISYTATIPNNAPPASSSFQLQGFDTSLGTLSKVTLDLVANVSGTIRVTNYDTHVNPFTDAYARVLVTVDGPGPTSVATTAEATVASGVAAAAPDPDSSKRSFFTGMPGSHENVTVLTSGFGGYEGVGSWYANFNALRGPGNFGGNTIGNMDFGGTVSAGGTFTVAYTYTAAVPEVSTWGMMGLGFAGLGFAGYRLSRKDRALVA